MSPQNVVLWFTSSFFLSNSSSTNTVAHTKKLPRHIKINKKFTVKSLFAQIFFSYLTDRLRHCANDLDALSHNYLISIQISFKLQFSIIMPSIFIVD